MKPFRNALNFDEEALLDSMKGVSQMAKDQIKSHKVDANEEDINDFIDAYLAEMRKQDSMMQCIAMVLDTTLKVFLIMIRLMVIMELLSTMQLLQHNYRKLVLMQTSLLGVSSLKVLSMMVVLIKQLT